MFLQCKNFCLTPFWWLHKIPIIRIDTVRSEEADGGVSSSVNLLKVRAMRKSVMRLIGALIRRAALHTRETYLKHTETVRQINIEHSCVWFMTMTGSGRLLMIYCSSRVSGHQLPGNNLLWKQHEGCQWPDDNLICRSQPELGCNQVWRSGSEEMKEIFYSNDVYQHKQPMGSIVA